MKLPHYIIFSTLALSSLPLFADDNLSSPTLSSQSPHFKVGMLRDLIEVLEEDFGSTISLLGVADLKSVRYELGAGSLEDRLLVICEANDLNFWKQVDGSYAIADQEYFEHQFFCGGHGIVKIFRPEHMTARKLQDHLKIHLTPDLGAITIDETTNKMIIQDEPEVIQFMMDLLAVLDNPKPVL